MRAISSMATRALLADLAAAARDAGLPSVEIESVGGVDAEARVAAGEQLDLVFLASGALARLAVGGHVDEATVTPIALSQTAVAVPSDAVATATATAPGGAAFADATALRAALRAAGRIGYSTGPSGTALVRLIEEWGLAEELGGRLVQARAGVPVAASLAVGDVDLGFQQLSELAGSPASAFSVCCHQTARSTPSSRAPSLRHPRIRDPPRRCSPSSRRWRRGRSSRRTASRCPDLSDRARARTVGPGCVRRVLRHAPTP